MAFGLRITPLTSWLRQVPDEALDEAAGFTRQLGELLRILLQWERQ